MFSLEKTTYIGNMHDINANVMTTLCQCGQLQLPGPSPATWRAGEWPVRAGVISPAQLSLPPAAQCSVCRYTPVSRVTIYTRVPIHTRRHDHGPGEAGEHRDRGGGGRHRHLQQQRPLRLRQVGAVLVLSVSWW